MKGLIAILAILTSLWHAPASASDILWIFQTREFNCLVKNIYYESRGETVKGQEAVALVTLNRVKDPRWPDTICKTVYQKNQFSWTRDKVPRVKNFKAWQLAENVAYRVLTGDHSFLNFKAVYFHTPQVRPIWKRKVVKVAKIGNHIFYV